VVKHYKIEVFRVIQQATLVDVMAEDSDKAMLKAYYKARTYEHELEWKMITSLAIESNQIVDEYLKD
jgi:hypothetical protein